MKTAMDAVKFLVEQSIKVARVAAKMDDTHSDESPFKKAIIVRSEIMMDCAEMIKEWAEKE